MIEFSLKGTLVAIPRVGQSTTEWRRAYHEEHKGEVGCTRGWVEPQRWGVICTYVDQQPVDTRYTQLKVDHASGIGDFWVRESEVGKAAFEQLLELELGDEVSLRGFFVQSNSFWNPTVTKARVLLKVEA